MKKEFSFLIENSPDPEQIQGSTVVAKSKKEAVSRLKKLITGKWQLLPHSITEVKFKGREKSLNDPNLIERSPRFTGRGGKVRPEIRLGLKNIG